MLAQIKVIYRLSVLYRLSRNYCLSKVISRQKGRVISKNSYFEGD